ncbi:MAG: phosphoenolpyruvate synthase [Clostridiales Family XIII bacterium]|jgi:pyruvate,water dikinase|nr:phosphoenolpyruvate synthase [Clostridiales Family XIII bacterium]
MKMSLQILSGAELSTDSIAANLGGAAGARFGGKAAGLACLEIAGANVPRWFCITEAGGTDADSPIDREDEDFAAALDEYLALHFPDTKTFAVRSSSALEDGRTHSFAGQFETYLDVPRTSVAARIRDCMDHAASGEAASKYAEAHQFRNAANTENVSTEDPPFETVFDPNLDPDLKIETPPAFSVIVQEMVDADVSGVIFTANPQGLLNETVIIAGCGTGHNVVTDRVPVTTYYYNTTDKRYYYEAPGANAPLLADALVHELAALAAGLTEKLTDKISPYLDIEYAIKGGVIYALQVRPITTLTGTDPVILDNSNIVESYPGITFPLTCSFVRTAYTGVFRNVAALILKSGKTLASLEALFPEMVGMANGRVYYRISNWYALLQLFPFRKRLIAVWQEMMGVQEKSVTGTDAGRSRSRFQTLRAYFNFFVEFLLVPRRMKKLEADFDGINTFFYDTFRDGLTADELIDLYEALSDKILAKWGVTLLNDIYAFVFTGLLKSRLRKRFPDDFEQRTNAYITGVGNLESMKPIRALIKVANFITENGARGELENLNSDAAVDRYLRSGSAAAIRINEYIALYGDRYLEELKLESPTFRSQPRLLIEKLLEYTQSPEMLAERTAIEPAPRIPGGPLIRFLSKRAMTGIRNREISRLNRSRIYGMIRLIFGGLADILVNAAVIEAPEDIFYLTIEEVFETATETKGDGSCVLTKGDDFRTFASKTRIDQRKKHYRAFSELPAYSRLVFETEVFDKHPHSMTAAAAGANDRILTGTACSPGICEGEVLVVETAQDASDCIGKILVAKMTDPGWVFLIAQAKGIISERGSLLSHTAIISRELKVPAVVGVPAATATLKTGDTVRLNGNTGFIELLSRGGWQADA